MEWLIDVCIDTLKLLPVLFPAYLIMEYLEKRLDSLKLDRLLKHYGPLLGAGFGVLPQCGFSVLAAALYLEGKVTLGTLISVFIATSDETIPILMAYPSAYHSLLLLIVFKVVIAIIIGYVVDYFIKERKVYTSIISKDEEQGPLKSALLRTLKIALFIFLTNIVVTVLINTIGQKQMNNILLRNSIWQPLAASLFGFIPNCAISVVLCQLFLKGTLSFASLLSGLITNAGMGLIVLIEYRLPLCKLLLIMMILLGTAVLFGLLFQLIA